MARALQISFHHFRNVNFFSNLTFNCNNEKIFTNILCNEARFIHSTTTNNDYRPPPVDPGTRRRSRIFKDDEEFLADVQDEEDFAQLESDFDRVDMSYKEHKRQIYKKRDHMSKMTTVKKFFKEPSAPSMLTWAERMQIRQLHESDPEEWSVDVLAESFPASREIIGKVIKAQWIPQNKEKMERMDKLVKVNWELLAQDRLEGDPRDLAHLKKFLHRREEYLAAIGTEELDKFLNKEEPKKRWNNGQMTSILESYEKELEKIDEKATKLLAAEKVDLLEDSQGQLQAQSEKADIDIVRERIKFEQEFNATNDGGFKIGGETLGDTRSVTLDELKGNLAGKSVNLDPLERVIVATTKLNADKANRPHINNRLAALAGYSIPPYKPPKNTSWGGGEEDTENATKETLEVLAQEVPSSRLAEELAEKSDSFDSDETIPEISKKKTPTLYQTYDEFIEEAKEDFSTKSSLSGMEDSRVNKTPLNCSTDLEREDLVKEESSIEGTFFWPCEKKVENLVQDSSEFSESPVPSISEPTEKVVADFRTSTQPLAKKVEEVPSPMDYPEKIKIPKDKQSKGMTYRVNDCFYDADGQFLYRVPGMTKA